MTHQPKYQLKKHNNVIKTGTLPDILKYCSNTIGSMKASEFQSNGYVIEKEKA